jgi:Fuc2NAc and GlcNAc transferase
MLNKFVIILSANVLSMVAAAALTRYIRSQALAFGILDVPNQRSSHVTPTPRGGGIAIVIVASAWLIGIWSMKLIPGAIVTALLASGSLIAAIGWLDDRHSVPASWRLFVHLLAASILVWSLTPFAQHLDFMEGWQFPLGIVLCIIAITWMLNLYNFMDGIDGLAGVEAVTVAGSAAVLIYSTYPLSGFAMACSVTASAALGFLWWNWPKARIFMGDGGSGWLGFYFGALALCSSILNILSLWAWLILLGVFIVDATLTLFRRMFSFSGEPFSQAHDSHAYQRLARHFGSHRTVTLSVLAINILWLLPLAAVAVANPQFAVLVLIVAWAPLFVIWLWATLRC